MQFRDLQKQYQVLKPQLDEAMLQTALRSDFISGKAVTELEKKLAEYVGVKHCISCANGTDALTLALKIWKIGPGDAVFVPDFTFIATAEVVSLEGATPIFVDVNLDTFNLDPNSLKKAIQAVIEEGILTPRVVIPVDLFGLPANYPSIQAICQEFSLHLLEDGAQGFGGRIGNQLACSFGDISTTSFFPAKPLGCYGDGGAVFTNNDEWAALMHSIKVHGKGEDKYDNVRVGLNSRLDTLQAAILIPKLEAFSEYELKRVNDIAQLYTKVLNGLVKTPRIPTDYYSSWAQYTIQLSSKEIRNQLQQYLKEQGIPSMIYYPKGMHQQSVYTNIKRYIDNPNSTQLANTVLSLPMHPYLEDEEVLLVCEAIKSYLH